MISARPERLKRRARAWQRAIASAHGQLLSTTVVSGESAIGGGALPGETLPTWVLRLSSPVRVLPTGWQSSFAPASPPLVVRIEDEAVVLDPRTVLPAQDQAVRHILASLPT